MSSLRQQIVDGLAVRLATITRGNGYQTDAGANVFAWRKYAIAPGECPCLLVQDTDLTTDYSRIIGLSEKQLTCEIVAVAAGDTSVTQARAIEADLFRCLAGWETAGGLADRLLIDKSSLVMEQHDKVAAAVQMTVAITYTNSRDLC
jgi:hypothetical protein